MVEWSEEEIEVLYGNYGVAPVPLWANKLPKRSVNAIQKKAQRLGLQSRLQGNQHVSPVFDPRIRLALPKTKDLEDIWDAIKRFQDASVKLSTRVEDAHIDIPTDEPIALGFLADSHIGAITCEYDELEKRIDMMAATDGFYLFSVGDTIDNYLPSWHNQGMFGQLIPPELQKQLVEHQFMKLKGKWLGTVQGCHDEASHEADDFDWNKFLASRLECPNLGFGATIHLIVGDTNYDVMLRHKYRYNSSFNLTHTVKRMREQLGDFDIGCIAHHHQAAIEQVMQGDGVDRLFIRPGSFKGPDRYARRLGFNHNGSFTPTVILYPDRRRMMPFLHLDDAVTVLSVLRS